MKPTAGGASIEVSVSRLKSPAPGWLAQSWPTARHIQALRLVRWIRRSPVPLVGASSFFLAEPFALHRLIAYSVDDVPGPLDTTNESALIGDTRVEGWGQGRFLCQAGAALFYSWMWPDRKPPALDATSLTSRFAPKSISSGMPQASSVTECPSGNAGGDHARYS